MNVPAFAARASKLAVDNSPVILTAIGVTGTITTAVLTGKATFKAAALIESAQTEQDMYETGHPLTTQEKVKVVWKEYIPPVLLGVATVTAILTANRVNAKRMAALAAAYSLTEKQFTDYKDKIVEKLSPAKEQAARDEIAQERVAANPPPQPIVVSGTDAVCYESYTGRYFKCSVNVIEKARNDMNLQIIDNSYATLGDFYERIGLDTTAIANEVGWNVDCPMDIYIGTTLMTDGQPCLVLDYKKLPFPIREYSFQAE